MTAPEAEAQWAEHQADLLDVAIKNQRAARAHGGLKVTIFFDGGTRIGDGHAAGAAVIYAPDLVELAAVAEYLPHETTNNVAEYTGLLIGLEAAFLLGATDVVAFGDSELIVRQVRGDYEARKPHLRKLRDEAWTLGSRFKTVKIQETPRGGKSNRRRNNNERADELANICMDTRSNIICEKILPFLQET